MDMRVHDHAGQRRELADRVRESAPDPPGETADALAGDLSPEEVRERRRRRARFLRELAEARELRERVTPHRSRRARIHAALRHRTFRIN
ncbi:hypothetical protein [Actinomadura parmotrematis]|uniref:DUF3263 domain-containing protein n=1 Tax=Actinomadura parmotrematis TaxID=2864039 RepID=A0ABS7G381_9ACTN|nr:hypothetical protein [Actinomadura parmotrematis]MBW8487006.1 hypothetical protein [Actinomadura parmotrematis]